MRFVILLLLLWVKQACSSGLSQMELASQKHALAELVRLTQDAQGYDKAFGLYRLGIAYKAEGDTDKANVLLDQASVALSLAKKENECEIQVLQGSIWGLRAGLTPLKAAYYGPKSQGAAEQALALDENNPRVHLLLGINAYSTPRVFGGSKTRALAHLDKALALFFSQGEGAKSWGHLDALAWKGMTLVALEREAEARLVWQQAQAMAPQSTWIARLLNTRDDK